MTELTKEHFELHDKNKAKMHEDKKKKRQDKTFYITISELTAKVFKVKALNEDMAWDKIKNDGYWEYEQIGDDKLVEWNYADCEEINNEDKLVKNWQDEIAMKKGEGK